jgi:hypothetical protein
MGLVISFTAQNVSSLHELCIAIQIVHFGVEGFTIQAVGTTSIGTMKFHQSA